MELEAIIGLEVHADESTRRMVLQDLAQGDF